MTERKLRLISKLSCYSLKSLDPYAQQAKHKEQRLNKERNKKQQHKYLLFISISTENILKINTNLTYFTDEFMVSPKN